MVSQDYTEIENVKVRLLSSSLAKIPTVLTLTKISFALHFDILVLWAIIFSFYLVLLLVVNFNLEDRKLPGIASIMTQKMVTGFFPVYQS